MEGAGDGRGRRGGRGGKGSKGGRGNRGGRGVGTEGAEGGREEKGGRGKREVLCELKDDSSRLINKNRVDFSLETFGTARLVLESEQSSCGCG